MTKRIFLVLLTTLFAVNAAAEYVEYPRNKDGSIITGVLTAGMDPLALAGEQTGAGDIAFPNRTPCSASQSMFGVSIASSP